MKGWALDPDAPTQPLAIRVYVGGRAGTPGASEYELGRDRHRPRADVGAKYPTAGPSTASTPASPTIKSGPQPVCVYALNAGPGADSLLGCKTIGIPVAVVLSNLKATSGGGAPADHLRMAVGNQLSRASSPCAPGSRSRSPTAAARRRGSAPSPARSGAAPSSLTGKRSTRFQIPFSARAGLLLQQRGRLKAQLIAAIPGGRRIRVLGIEHRAR